MDVKPNATGQTQNRYQYRQAALGEIALFRLLRIVDGKSLFAFWAFDFHAKGLRRTEDDGFAMGALDADAGLLEGVFHGIFCDVWDGWDGARRGRRVRGRAGSCQAGA